jgi:hypothetical protein
MEIAYCRARQSPTPSQGESKRLDWVVVEPSEKWATPSVRWLEPPVWRSQRRCRREREKIGDGDRGMVHGTCEMEEQCVHMDQGTRAVGVP